MKCYKIIDYINLYDTICPTDAMVGNVVTSEWWSELKNNFDDIFWLYFADRVLFMNERFSSDYVDDNYDNIRRTFAVWLKTKKHLIDRLYNGYVSDFNPLWNVDGVEGFVSKDSHTGTNTDSHSGYDKREYEDNGDTTRSGNEVIAVDGDDLTTNTATTFDSATDYLDSTKSNLNHDTETTHTYNNVKDEKDYDGFSQQNYNSSLEHEFDELNEHMDIKIRQGNIGVTKSTDLLNDNQDLYMNEKMDIWKWICRMLANQITYTVEGVI